MSEMRGELAVGVEQRDGVTLVRLSGEGVLNTGAYLNDRLDQVAGSAGPRVVVDLSGLTYASSLVMGALVRFRGVLRQDGRSLRLAAAQPSVAESLRVSNLGKFLAVFETLDEALAAD